MSSTSLDIRRTHMQLLMAEVDIQNKKCLKAQIRFIFTFAPFMFHSFNATDKCYQTNDVTRSVERQFFQLGPVRYKQCDSTVEYEH